MSAATTQPMPAAFPPSSRNCEAVWVERPYWCWRTNPTYQPKGSSSSAMTRTYSTPNSATVGYQRERPSRRAAVRIRADHPVQSRSAGTAKSSTVPATQSGTPVR